MIIMYAPKSCTGGGGGGIQGVLLHQDNPLEATSVFFVVGYSTTSIL